MKLSISKSKNSESLYIQKSIRKNGVVSTLTVKKLGTMASLLPDHHNSRDEVIAWAKALAASMTEQDNLNKDTVLIPLSQSKLINFDKRTLFNGGYLFLQSIFHSLMLDKMCLNIQDNFKFDYDLADILAKLIYTRIIFPSSKFSSFEDSKRFIEQPSFKLHDIYRALDVLADKSEYIQEFLYEKSLNVVKRNTSVLYYDCTNYFFEIEEERGDAKYGKSKENRPLPIVQMGLFLDGNGFPLSFVLFPGNESEQPTLIPLEKRIIKDFQLSKFIVCTDAGLASNDNRKFNNKGDRSYIVTQSLKKLKRNIRDWALDPTGWSKDDKNNIDITPIIQKCDNGDAIDDQIWYKERWMNENGIEQRIIVSFSPKYRAYQRSVRNRQVERALKAVDKNENSVHRNPNSPSRFLEEVNYTENGEIASNTKIRLNNDKVIEEERYDGFYAVCTTLEDDIDTIISINKRRWEIEESFRIIKSEFEARPVYLQKDNRIKAHFLTCFLALFFIRMIESKIKYQYTVENIIDTLREFNFQYFEGSGYVPAYSRTKITDSLHEAFNFRTDYQIVGEKNMKKIIKKTKH